MGVVGSKIYNTAGRGKGFQMPVEVIQEGARHGHT
jgi:hypothetical protein